MGRKPKNTIKAVRDIVFRGRTSRPKIHIADNLRAFIKVRKKGGGTKRLYLDTNIAMKGITRGWSALTITAGKQIEKIMRFRNRK